MTLVERLRYGLPKNSPGMGPVSLLAFEAADRIEQLEQALRECLAGWRPIEEIVREALEGKE